MQSDRELFPGVKLFFQLGNFFIMDSETLAVNSYQETQQAAISEVLKKNSLTERVTSTKNRVCENHFNITRSRLHYQRTRRLRQLLDLSITLQHEVRLLQLERQRQAIEVKKRLQPDAHLKYEDIRLCNRERHLGVNMAPCYLDKRQQFSVRLRSTKDDSLTPTVRTARARLKQHQLENCKRNDPSTSSSRPLHGAKPTSAPLADTSTGLQQHGLTPAPVSAVSEPARRAQPGFSTPPGRSYTASSSANRGNHSHYNGTQYSINNHTKHTFNNLRKSSVSYYTIHSLDNHPQSSFPNHTHSSLSNHITSSPSNLTTFYSNNHTNISVDNHTSVPLHKNTHHKLDSDLNPNDKHSTNEMLRKIISPARESYKLPRNPHFSATDPPNTSTEELRFSDEDDDDDDNSHSRLDIIDLHAHFCGDQNDKDTQCGDVPIAKQTRANQPLCELREQGQASLKRTGTTRTPTTDIQVRVAAFLKKLSPSQNDNIPTSVREVQLVSPTKQQILDSSKTKPTEQSTINDAGSDPATFTSTIKPLPIPGIVNRNTTAMLDPAMPKDDIDANAAEIRASNTTSRPPRENRNRWRDITATSISEMKPSSIPGIVNPHTTEMLDSAMPEDDTDENAAEIATNNMVSRTPRKRYSWRDIKVRSREGHPGECCSAEDLVLQALTGIPIRNVFQTPVPLNTASRAMRHTATYKMHKIVERMIKDRTRYERHQVEEMKKQMTMELQGQVIAEEELSNLAADQEPSHLS